MEVDVARDFFTESSPAALRGVFASWSLPECKDWYGGCAACAKGGPLHYHGRASRYFCVPEPALVQILMPGVCRVCKREGQATSPSLLNRHTGLLCTTGQ